MRGHDEARVVLTPIATPLPLTFVGLMVASLILSDLELGWVPSSETQTAGWVLLGVPLPLQLVAAVFGFHGRSATAATGSSTLAAAVLVVAPIRFAVTAVTGLTQSSGLRHATGILGLVVAAAALYAALALELEDNARLDVQVEQLENEAGVRENL